MSRSSSIEVYSPSEIARAAGVPIERVLAAIGHPRRDGVYLAHGEAVRLGRTIIASDVDRVGPLPTQVVRESRGLFSIFESAATQRSRGLPLAVSSTLHAGVVGAAVLMTTFGFASSATTLATDGPAEDLHMVFVATPGPGGGGGGGGLRQPAPPPKAQREGNSRINSPLPERRPPPAIEPEVAPPPPRLLDAEPLPALVVPIVTAPADERDRIGVLEQAKPEAESNGPGRGGGVGTGSGTGLGQGDGSGVGDGWGGGTGGGPYRPGSGIEPPRLLREVKADYTDEARRRGLKGEVVLEIVVRRDGTVSDVKVLRRLGSGLDEAAVQAIRQWRFAPATRRGLPVDVIVEVAVEFNLR